MQPLLSETRDAEENRRDERRVELEDFRCQVLDDCDKRIDRLKQSLHNDWNEL